MLTHRLLSVVYDRILSMMILSMIFVCMVLVATPLLLARTFCHKRSWESQLSTAGWLAVALIIGVMLILHHAQIAITPRSLWIAHTLVFVMAVTLLILQTGKKQVLTRNSSHERVSRTMFFASIVVLIILIFPYTSLTGIDTYKWQDLATSIRMEEALAWVIHPLSLIGFTPRSYPIAYPGLLATIQTGGHLGVEGGFRVLSIFVALLGFASATTLGNKLFCQKTGWVYGWFYVMSPVFIRYTHWATGRGLFLALFPLFIAHLCEGHTPSQHKKLKTIQRFSTITILAVLLLLSHKVAWVAIPATLGGIALSSLVCGRLVNERKHWRWSIITFLVLLAGAMVTPTLFPGPFGRIAGLIRTALVRFNWMLPLAILAMIFPSSLNRETVSQRQNWTRLTLTAMLGLPLGFEQQMYGALFALPFICLFAVRGWNIMMQQQSLPMRQIISGVTIILTLAGSMTIVIWRSLDATPTAWRQAAFFLEQHDPEGPFMIHAPEKRRTRLQAYLSGCPRFEVRAQQQATVLIEPMPGISLSMRENARGWGAWLRNLFRLSKTRTLWYGVPKHHYYFFDEDNQRDFHPDDKIYHQNGIVIYKLPHTAP